MLCWRCINAQPAPQSHATAKHDSATAIAAFAAGSYKQRRKTRAGTPARHEQGQERQLP